MRSSNGCEMPRAFPDSGGTDGIELAPERGPVVEDLDRSSRSDDLAKGEQKSI